jgi:hypothetical protein
MTLNFLALYGFVHSERQRIRFARFLKTQLGKRGQDVTLADPCNFDLPLLDKMYKEYPEGQGPEPYRNSWS